MSPNLIPWANSDWSCSPVHTAVHTQLRLYKLRLNPLGHFSDRRIEDLVVREYLERDKDDMQKFRYLA